MKATFSFRAGTGSRLRSPTLALRLLVLLLTLVSSSFAADLKAKKAAPLPPAVRQAVQALVGDGKLLDVERTVENGRPVFEGEFRQDGVVRGFTFTPDGMLIARQVFEKELPPAVAQALRAQLAGATPGDLYWTNDDGNPAYYAEFTRGTEKRSLTIAPDGTLVAEVLPLAAAPPAVQKAIRDHGGFLVKLELQHDDAGDYFEAGLRKAGKLARIELKPDGSTK
ncbi:MAG: hypothetical protein ACKODH_01130 [Limisphaerales bacterium]